MPDTIVFIASATAALAAILATSLLTPRTRVHTSVQSIQELLGPHDLPLSALLRARAKPNHRLVKALGISSTFVTDDPHVHESFTHEAKHLIAVVSAKDHGDGWMGFVDMVDICVNRYLNSESLDYATFVQSATLSIVLTGLLGADIEDLDLADVEFVTKAINDRWAQSKANDALPTEVLDQINSHITRWVPDRVNPLNLIIPAYETMWRVVAIAVVYSNRDRILRDAFISYNENPTFHVFTGEATEEQPSVEAIITEVLRLHPPTSHITRSVDVPWWKRPFVPCVEVADIEEAQRSILYGSDPHSFNPMRFHDGPKKEHLYAFGYGKLSCLAASWAPSAAAVIAAKILATLDDTLTLKEGPHIGKRDGWEGWSIERT